MAAFFARFQSQPFIFISYGAPNDRCARRRPRRLSINEKNAGHKLLSFINSRRRVLAHPRLQSYGKFMDRISIFCNFVRARANETRSITAHKSRFIEVTCRTSDALLNFHISFTSTCFTIRDVSRAVPQINSLFA